MISTGALAGVAAFVGLAFGSFATVVAWRVPRSESIVKPGSHCPLCNTPVKPYDNVPVLSFLVLRGKCRHCKATFGIRYPLMELAVPLLFAAVTLRVGARWEVPAYCALALVLVILTDIDLEHRKLPVKVVYPGVVIGAALLVLAAAGLHDWGALGRAAIGGAGAAVVFALIFFLARGGMGFGDVRLAGLCGMFLAFLGWRFLAVGFFAAFVTAGLIGLALLASGRAGRKTAIPYGPFLALGTMIGVLFGLPIANVWLGH
jgi:leader peptidase (prepilin peptidase) / N-methyltransferase